MPGFVGRPRTPDDIKVLSGTFRPGRDGDPAQAVQMDGEPTPPPGLSPEALSAWHYLVPPLVKSGIAKAADSAMLGLLCQHYAWHLEGTRRLNELLEETKGTTGEEDDSQALRRLQAFESLAYKDFADIACRFGLTPADRTRLRVQPKDEEGGVVSRKRNA